MVSIEIDNQIYQVPEGTNLLQACLSLGLDLPYFCWHPALGSVGACRQCAVIQYQDRHDEVEGDQRDEVGRLVMSCMTPVTEGMRISIQAKSAQDFRSDIIELLMTNHPHDCPVCEEGGECHLQDMTQMSGHTYRQYSGKKRTHKNQYLGPFINHEMNRCIACYRCVRYYQDYAGGHDLQAMASHHHVYFGRSDEGVLESEFSGNLVEVCPTGVFTDRTFSAHYSRKWDLQQAPSICVHCAHGCNTSPGERYGSLRRIINRYNGAVNSYFLCDRGRFGYDFVNHPERPIRVLERDPSDRAASPAEFDRAQTRDWLQQALAGEVALIGIGSERASLEANFALRQLVGAEQFHMGMGDNAQMLVRRISQILQAGVAALPDRARIEQADYVLILGEDVLHTQPRLALSLRQTAANIGQQLAQELRIPAWQDAAVRCVRQTRKTPILIATPLATGIDDIAEQTYRASPQEIACLGFAIASALDADAPLPEGMSEVQQSLAQQIAKQLRSAKRPLIISGTACAHLGVIEASANIAKALVQSAGSDTDVALHYCLPAANSLGLALLDEGRGLENWQQVKERLASKPHHLVLLENDLTRQLQIDQLKELCDQAQRVILLDDLPNAAAQYADISLPTASFAECEGTWVSASARAQRSYAVMLPQGDVRAAWEWLADLIALRQQSAQPPWQHLEEVTQACAEAVPLLANITAAAPPASTRLQHMKIGRQPHRYSGRTAMQANRQVSEAQQPADDSPLAYSMEGFAGDKPAALTPYYWSPGWNSNQSVNKFQDEIGGALRGGDPGVSILAQTKGAPLSWFAPTLSEPAGDGDYLLLPAYHIFGSEEQSRLAAAIQERSPKAYVRLNEASASALEVAAGDGLELQAGEERLSLAVQIAPELPDHWLVVPAGLPETAALPFGEKVKACKDPDWRAPTETVICTDAGGQS